MKEHIRILILDSYLAAIKGSVGSKMFRHLFASVGRKKKDIARDGVLSCGIFVSRILVMFGLIDGPHATVDGTLKAMKESGWRRIKSPRIGAVVVWEPILDKEGEHRHIGFSIGNGRAISNSTLKRVPVIHPLVRPASKGNAIRRVESIWWHRRLSKNV